MWNSRQLQYIVLSETISLMLAEKLSYESIHAIFVVLILLAELSQMYS